MTGTLRFYAAVRGRGANAITLLLYIADAAIGKLAEGRAIIGYRRLECPGYNRYDSVFLKPVFCVVPHAGFWGS
jgi:hypothetical protein